MVTQQEKALQEQLATTQKLIEQLMNQLEGLTEAKTKLIALESSLGRLNSFVRDREDSLVNQIQENEKEIALVKQTQDNATKDKQHTTALVVSIVSGIFALIAAGISILK